MRMLYYRYVYAPYMLYYKLQQTSTTLLLTNISYVLENNTQFWLKKLYKFPGYMPGIRIGNKKKIIQVLKLM